MFLKKRIIATAAVTAMAAAAVYGSTQEMSQTQESGSGLQLFRGKETIYCWYSDEALSGYINAAAVSFGEQNSGVRVIPVLTSDSEYLEAINQETLHSDQIPDIYLLSSDSLEKAYLAGLAVGYWSSKEEIRKNWNLGRTFEPTMEEAERAKLLKGWHRAVRCALAWSQDED